MTVKWGDAVLPPKVVQLSKYRRRRRPPFTDLTRFVTSTVVWLGMVILMAVWMHDPFIICAAFTGVGMGAALAIWTRHRGVQ